MSKAWSVLLLALAAQRRAESAGRGCVRSAALARADAVCPVEDGGAGLNLIQVLQAQRAGRGSRGSVNPPTYADEGDPQARRLGRGSNWPADAETEDDRDSAGEDDPHSAGKDDRGKVGGGDGGLYGDDRTRRQISQPAAPTTCSNSNDKNWVTGKMWQDIYQSEYPVNNHSADCGAPANKVCQGQFEGCGLVALATDRCTEPSWPHCSGDKPLFAYSGSSQGQQQHVIAIPLFLTRGIEDILPSRQRAADETNGIWKIFWDDSVNNRSGADGTSGFNPTQGGLCINPANHREYHQMHLHAGQRLNRHFNDCVEKLNYTEVLSTRFYNCSNLSSSSSTKTAKDGGSVAYLHYRMVRTLDRVWANYTEMLANVSIKGVAANRTHYYTGLLLLQPRGLKGADYFIILYTPISGNHQDGIGRGHFFVEPN